MQKKPIAVAWHYMNLGLLIGNWVARLKDILEINHLSYTTLGSVLVCAAVGGLFALPVAAKFSDRFGSAKCLFFGNIFLAVLMPFLGISGGGIALLAPVFFSVGIGFAFCDVAMTGQGITVEKESHRNHMGFFEAMMSVGNFLGVLFGGAMAHIGLMPLKNFSLLTAASIPTTCYFYRFLTPYDEELNLLNQDKKETIHATDKNEVIVADTATEENTALRTIENLEIETSDVDYSDVDSIFVENKSSNNSMSMSSRNMLIYLSVTGFCAQIGEATIADWATIYFRDDLGTSPLVGVLGYASFSFAMAAGRLSSDKLGHIYSRSFLLRFGGGLGSGGLGLTVLAPSLFENSGSVALAVIGLFFSGLGLSVGLPVVLSAAGDVPDMKASDAIALVTGVTYVGYLVAPPFFGYMADVLGAVRWSLLMCTGMLLIILVVPGSPPLNKRCQIKKEGERDDSAQYEEDVSPLHSQCQRGDTGGYSSITHTTSENPISTA